MAKPRAELTHADRAVYDLVCAGGLNAIHRPLYHRELSRLAAAGLIRLDERGQFVDAAKAPLPPAEPVPPPMGTLVVRVPNEVIEALDRLGPTRSRAARRVLAEGVAAKLAPSVPPASDEVSRVRRQRTPRRA